MKSNTLAVFYKNEPDQLHHNKIRIHILNIVLYLRNQNKLHGFLRIKHHNYNSNTNGATFGIPSEFKIKSI